MSGRMGDQMEAAHRTALAKGEVEIREKTQLVLVDLESEALSLTAWWA